MPVVAADDETKWLQHRLRVLLPENYRVFDETVRPASMRSAGLKFDAGGKVLWNEMWGSFCDLAMAGGPPHRGRFLAACAPDATDASSPAYRQVCEELCRGIGMVTGLCAEPSPVAGWVRLYCTSAAMAGWLMRAIVMENVAASAHGLALDLPASSTFRIEKEIKNVVTAVAKTCHYWQDHMADEKHDEIAALLAQVEREFPLTRLLPEAASRSDEDRVAIRARIASEVSGATGLTASVGGPDWVGFDCGQVPAAVWMMRALAVSNVLARREEQVVFVPAHSTAHESESHLVQAFVRAHRLAIAHRILE